MPRGGAHRSFWDLSHFHAGADAVDASAPFASSTSSTASSTSSIASAASASDFDAAAAEGQGDQTGYGIEPATDATVREADTNAATAEAEAIVDRDELANGYRAMSVEPAKQGEGRVTEMLAAAAEEQAERRAAAERETAAEATRTAVRQARARRRGAERGYGNRRAGPIARRRDVRRGIRTPPPRRPLRLRR